MALAIQIASYLFAIPMQVLTIAALLRGAWRQFPLVFAYVTISFLATVTEMPAAFNYIIENKTVAGLLATLYWLNEVILQILILVVVISFTYSGTSKFRSRRLIRVVLPAGAGLFSIVAFLIHYDSTQLSSRYMTLWARDMKLCSTLLCLALWSVLIGARQKDQLLLLLTGAMGIMFTGEAIGGSISAMAIEGRSRPIALFGGTISVIAHNLFLYMWWQALRRVPVHSNKQQPA